MKAFLHYPTLENKNNYGIVDHDDYLNGTAALHIALLFAGVKANDDVLVPALLSQRLINIPSRQHLI